MGMRDGLGSLSGKVAPRRARHGNYFLKFTGNAVGDPGIRADNARYEGTAETGSGWVLKRAAKKGTRRSEVSYAGRI